ncbi:hypothetical protein HXX76_011432 [Chlamydomonas incerta]|uniref:Uncharacterized protein n=1 Tax=Chlamydomonas incerta TaxID=51695 RepID=A0A835VX27_CHLIN|nr:hypothetical protein HXX76_011432 [Chlamydomonas incerta]|eukprot:KAG2428729.1 hypothetical protein HXX76_011432 [Chlamydomonas incerta]
MLLLLPAATLAARPPPPPAPKPKTTAAAASVPKLTPQPRPSPSPALAPSSDAAAPKSAEADDGEPSAADDTPPPQYTMGFGKCGPRLQRQRYGNWQMTYNISEQRPGKLVMWLDTQNRTAVADCFGEVKPQDFPMTAIYFAYFNFTEGVAAWSPALDLTPYRQTSAAYWIKPSLACRPPPPPPPPQVNGKSLFTVRDLKDFGTNTATSSTYSLKGTHNGLIRPSPSKYKIEIVKNCDTSDCTQIPEPSSVFISPQGHVVWSVWSVSQTLIVNGYTVLNHAWCPVQSAVNVQ